MNRIDVKQKINRYKILLLLIVGMLVLLAGLIGVRLLFLHSEREMIAERDNELFSLAYSVDNNLNLKLHEVSSELDYIVERADFKQAEKEMMENQNDDLISEFFQKSHLFNKPQVYGVVIRDNEKQLFSLDCKTAAKHEYIFLDDHDEDPLWFCYDEEGRYYIAVEKNSTLYNVEYYALFDLDHFHDAIIPDSIRNKYWIVFYDHESGLSMQNHKNQDPYMIMTEEEILKRQDGYTIIMENENKGTKGSITYEYNNYYGQMVPERLITLPSNETINGIFAIGISQDSQNLYKELTYDKYWLIGILTTMIILLAVTFALIYHFFEKQEKEKLELEMKKKEEEMVEQLTQARLKNSMSQLQPHFLYNALSSIRELVLDSPDYAYDMIYDFTHYLRACVRSISQNELIPFEEELENIRAYTSIEQMRFGNGLKIVFDIQESDFKIIPLGIQPLVENAIRHGIVKRRGKHGTVIVRSLKQADEIVITVEDDGLGFDVDQIRQDVRSGRRDSTGIQNLKFRFEHVMHAQMDISSEPSVGTKITIRIPMMALPENIQIQNSDNE